MSPDDMCPCTKGVHLLNHLWVKSQEELIRLKSRPENTK